MTKFYVYTSAKDELEIVEGESLEDFAAHEFDPTSMIFTGVVVEANDFATALKVYQNPACTEGEYMMADEPQSTVVRRTIANSKSGLMATFDKVQAKLEYLRACMLMQAAAFRMQEANRLMNEAAQKLFLVHGKPDHVPPQMIFNRLSEATIASQIKYHGDSTKPG
jgi:hypothetical protein